MQQPRPEPGRRTRFYQAVRKLLVLFSAIVYPSRIRGSERLEAMDAPYILIANHQSMMDPILLAVHLKRYEIHFLGKRELTKFSLLRWIVKKLHMIPVSRHQSDMGAMRASLEALKAGHVLALFPEGRRFPGAVPMAHIESGFLVLALRSQAPLLPVYIHGIPRPFQQVELLVGEPITFETLRQESADLSHDAVKAHIRGVFAQLRLKEKQKKYNSDRSAE